MSYKIWFWLFVSNVVNWFLVGLLSPLHHLWCRTNNNISATLFQEARTFLYFLLALILPVWSIKWKLSFRHHQPSYFSIVQYFAYSSPTNKDFTHILFTHQKPRSYVNNTPCTLLSELESLLMCCKCYNKDVKKEHTSANSSQVKKREAKAWRACFRKSYKKLSTNSIRTFWRLDQLDQNR